jgi:UPF0271 protein
VLIDLNSDLGEGAGTDADLLPLLTSANVSCGAHAGGPAAIAATLELARRHGVVVGAHPGHPDRDHFGRRELPTPPRDVLEQMHSQVRALHQLAGRAGVELKYLKPHGGLYHQACRDDAYADAVVTAAALAGLAVIGLPDSRLAHRADGRVPFVAEGFADRRYRPDGLLVPRSEPEAFVTDADEAVAQADKLARQGVRTICVHGDNPRALDFVRALRTGLSQRGYVIRAFPC